QKSRRGLDRTPQGGHMYHQRIALTLRAIPTALVALFAVGMALAGDEPSERFFRIERNAPGMEKLISPGAELELLGDRYGLTEGPVWVDSEDGGYLLFADLISNVIYKWAPKEGTTVFLEDAGYTGDDIYTTGTQTLRGR